MSFAAQLSPEYRFSPAPAVPRIATSLLNRTNDIYWETKLGVTTTGGAPSPHPDAHHYGSLSYDTYFRIFDHLQMTPTDVVVDLGSGKGRPNFVAAQYPIRESIGVEIDPPLCAMAEENRHRLRVKRAPVRFVCQSATEFDYDPVTIVVMFHPFGAETLREVLGCIEKSLLRNPRSLRIVYGNPLLSSLIAARPGMKLYDTWNPGTWSRVKFPVHFYRSTTA